MVIRFVLEFIIWILKTILEWMLIIANGVQQSISEVKNQKVVFQKLHYIFLSNAMSTISAKRFHQLSSFISVKLSWENYSTMEGQGIEPHVLDDSPCHFPEGNKINEEYISWKKDDNLIKSQIRGTLIEEVLYLVRVYPPLKK